MSFKFGRIDGNVCSRDDQPAGVSPKPWRKIRAPLFDDIFAEVLDVLESAAAKKDLRIKTCNTMKPRVETTRMP